MLLYISTPLHSKYFTFYYIHWTAANESHIYLQSTLVVLIDGYKFTGIC